MATYEYYIGTDAVYQDTFDTTTNTTPSILAQNFKVGLVGINENFSIEEVKLRLQKTGTPTGDLDVEIYDTDATTYEPTTLKCKGTIDLSTISTAGWYSCSNFVGNTSFAVDGRYAIRISHLSSSTALNYIRWLGDVNTGTPTQEYPYGESQTDMTCPFWISIDNGVSWIINDTFSDLSSGGFQVLGSQFNGTLCTYDDVISKVGTGANSAAREVYNVGLYVQKAESILNVRTKKNWTTLYSTLDTNVKYILSEIVSSLAAIQVINYDDTGYTGNVYQMLDNLDKNAERLINELKKEDIKNFMEAA
jgi:hypothetical protein